MGNTGGCPPSIGNINININTLLSRGNAAAIGQELRDAFGVQIYAVAIGASADQLGTLARIVGEGKGEMGTKGRVIHVDSVEELADPGQLAFLRRALCKDGKSPSRRRTTARGGGTKRQTAKRDTRQRQLAQLEAGTTPMAIRL
jgi:hypothetical protein